MARKHLEMKTQKEELQNMIRVGLKYLPANFLDVTCKSRGGVRSGADLRQAYYKTPARATHGGGTHCGLEYAASLTLPILLKWYQIYRCKLPS